MNRKNLGGIGGSMILGGGVLIGAAAASTPALAGTVTETAAIPVTETDWLTTAKIGQFNPALGSLQQISFGLTGTLHGTIGIENLEPVASTVYGNISSTISLSAPGAGQILSVTPSVGASANLAAFDGRIDFAGASGRTFSGLSSTQSAQTTYTAGAPGPRLPTAPYVGAGKVALPVSASASAGISGPLDLAARTTAAAGAGVTVKYGAGSASASGGGETLGSALTTTGTNIGVGVVSGAQHTAVQTRTLADQGGDWARNVTFNPFNRALGTLLSADLTLSGDLKSSLSVRDTGRTAGAFDAGQSAAFSLVGPQSAALGSATAAADHSGSLAPFAGTDSFSKPFGTTIDDAVLSALDSFSDEAKADFAFFSGMDPVALAVDAVGTLSAELPGSADLLSSGLEGATVTLSYTYLPSTAPAADPRFLEPLTPAVPEPGSLALLLSAIAGFGLIGRRRR
ncbi:MAG: choice-of-anchor E domain-containing protein [Stellaceae bacterium]